MAITYPLTFPTTVSPVATTWQLASLVSVVPSPFTFNSQIQEHEGQRWEIDILLPVCDQDEAGVYRAFFAALRGSRGTFLIGDHSRKTIKGGATQTGVVNGASQVGDELISDGWDTSTVIFKAGDWIQLGTSSSSRMYMIREDITSDVSGNATLKIVPNLRTSPSDNQEIIYSDCKSLFRLDRNVVPVFSADVNKYSRFQLQAVEAL